MAASFEQCPTHDDLPSHRISTSRSHPTTRLSLFHCRALYMSSGDVAKYMSTLFRAYDYCLENNQLFKRLSILILKSAETGSSEPRRAFSSFSLILIKWCIQDRATIPMSTTLDRIVTHSSNFLLHFVNWGIFETKPPSHCSFSENRSENEKYVEALSLRPEIATDVWWLENAPRTKSVEIFDLENPCPFYRNALPLASIITTTTFYYFKSEGVGLEDLLKARARCLSSQEVSHGRKPTECWKPGSCARWLGAMSHCYK